MNRMLTLPGLAIVAAFVVLYVGLSESNARPRQSPLPTVNTSEELYVRAERLDQATARQHLHKALIAPWHAAQRSPQELYSRVSPTPRPTPELKLEALASDEQEYFFGALILKKRKQLQHVPLAVDRSNGSVIVFADSHWQSHDQWLAKQGLISESSEPTNEHK
jgi:hypothetical protein